MILMELEAPLPAALEAVKAQTLVALGRMHSLHVYDTPGTLRDYLDTNLAQLRLVAPDVPGLTRVILFYRDPKALAVVEERMMPAGDLKAFLMPGCWPGFSQRLTELKAAAARFERHT